MVPKKDYEDYAKYINDVYVDEKNDWLNRSFGEVGKQRNSP